MHLYFMTKNYIVWFILLFSAVQLYAQKNKNVKDLDLGLERNERGAKPSSDWLAFRGNYIIERDSVIKYNGKYSLTIKSPTGKLDKQGITAIPFSPDFEGKVLELRGYLKLQDVKGGYAGLFLRADGENGVLFPNFMWSEKLTGTKDWARYSVKVPMTEDVKEIWIGAGLYGGTGQVWADDLEVLIDGKEVSKAKKRTIYPASLDSTFLKGSEISLGNIDSEKIKKIALFGRIWGFLKYHHPGAYSGNLNWDFELFRLMPKIMSTKSAKEQDDVYIAWIKQLGEFKTKKPKELDLQKVKMMPDTKWIDGSEMGEELKTLLERVKYAESKPSYYMKIVDEVPVPHFKNESNYINNKNLDVGYRLLSLFRYWNIVHYYFPYKYLLDEDWSQVLESQIPHFVNASNELEYKKTVKSLIVRINDSHAYMTEYDFSLFRSGGLRFPPFEIKFVEDKPVITDFFDDELGKSSGMKRGDVILSVGNTPVEKMVAEKLPYISASNYPTKLRNLAPELLRTNDSVLNISFKRSDSVLEAKIRTYTRQFINVDKNSNYQDTCFKFISKGIAYLNVGSYSRKYLPNIVNEISKSNYLIIDLRWYPKESIVKELGEYLFEKPTPFVKFAKIADQPGLFTFDEPMKIGKANPSFYKGKIILLVNEVTQSNGEFTAMGFRQANGAIVIGSQTAGADGNVTPIINLPGGISTVFTGLGVYYPDGKETQRIGIVPDIVVKPTVKGVTEGRDEVLEKALEVIANSTKK
ncbi:MAG: hypothetical protein EOO90_05895 [Pedobacter sp.]|nr:MAG: hypothetical protein EOO90_05895 [Pedobacter sp.]